MRMLLFLLCCALPAAQAAAPEWPAKPVRWIVPFAPGGATDLTARLVAQKLAERLARSVLVENRPGAASNIGMEAVARSAPDGYTILLVIPNVVTGPLFYKLNYDPMKELAPVALMTRAYSVLLVGPSSPANRSGSVCLNSFPRFISGLRANCGRCRVVHGGGRGAQCGAVT